MKKQRGFTLIELLVVIAIIGLLASVVVVALNSTRAKTRDTRRIQDLHQIRLALEMFFDANGYYPQSGCGWDCNGYRYSYNSASWTALENDLKPFLASLPKDPINSNCAPWVSACYSYTYGNVGRTTNPPQYDLTAQLETTHPERCEVKCWKWYFTDGPWCVACGGAYNNQIYEASPD